MKCSSCGAEIKDKSIYCEFCGSQISYDMKKEQEQLSKSGCPRCGSTNVSFSREKTGEVKGKKSSAVIRATVGVCKDCGHTWTTSSNSVVQMPKKRRTWLWVLGWIFCFPVPLTILLLRNKTMKPALKYGIIAVSIILYFLIVFVGGNDDKATTDNSSVNNTETIAEASDTKSTDKVIASFLLNSNDKGEYGKEISLNKGTENEYTFYIYSIPSGKYKITNNDKKSATQITVFKNEIIKNTDGVEEMATSDTNPIVVLQENQNELTIAEGEVIKLSDNSFNILFEKIA